jgi:hypothetical protein
MRFYISKIGGHLQELAVLALIFVPLDRHLTVHQYMVEAPICAVIIMIGIEMERRVR